MDAATERWLFDTSGYLHRTNTLDAAQLASAQRQAAGDAEEAARRLLQVEGLLDAVGAAADGEPRYRFESARLLSDAAGGGGWINSPLPSDARRLGWDVAVTGHPVKPLIRGFRAVWALGGAEVDVVPASHKASLAPPRAELAIEMGTATRLRLEAGDLLLLCGTTLVAGLPEPGGVLLECILAFDPHAAEDTLAACLMGERPLGDPKRALPTWFDDLTPAQQAVMGPGGTPAAFLCKHLFPS